MDAPSVYVDRHSGASVVEPIYAHRFLDWCYNSRSGWLATRFLFSRRWISKLWGWWLRQRWTRRRIVPFAKALGIKLDECAAPVESYGSLADFIVREIDLSRRPIDPRADVCVSPVDGRLLCFDRIAVSERLRVKRADLSFRELLDDGALAARFDGGAAVVCRLYLSDYHHFHFPVCGTPGRARPVEGRLFAVTPYARNHSVPYFAQNQRMITLLDSDRFGSVALVEVGAFTIGSIRQAYRPGEHVERGAHKGWFELGGSVVVLLFEPDRIELDADLLEHSRHGVETFVRLGESIGCVPARDGVPGRVATSARSDGSYPSRCHPS